MTGLINNKEKQYAAGNWGHPRKYIKKRTNIADPLMPEKPRRSKKKKKKKSQKPYISPYEVCPFCKNELKIIEKKKNQDNFYYEIFPEREHECRKCGAQEVKECPACKRKTWYRPSDGMYQHQGHFSCGFKGKKKWK